MTQRRALALALGLPLLASLSSVSSARADDSATSDAAQEEHAENITEQVDSEPGKGSDIRELLHLDVGPLSVSPRVLLQVQAIPYVGADSFLQTGDPSERGGFRLRRARFGFTGRLYGRVPFEVTAEYSSDDAGTAHLHDAWFGYDKWKPLQIFAGARDVPFSRSAMIDAGNGALIERPLAVRAMAPFHQLGVSVEGRLFSGILNYAAGVYNGLERSDQFFEGYTENSALLGNRWGGLTYAARLSSDPLGRPGRAIHDLYHDKFRLSLGASVFFSNGGTRDILGVGGDALLHYRGLHLLGEFLSNRTAPREDPSQTTNQLAPVQSLAAVGEVGYALLPKRFGIAARFEWLNPNTKAEDESDSWLVTGGISYHVLRDLLRAQVDYTHRQEIHGKSLKNDAVVIQVQFNL